MLRSPRLGRAGRAVTLAVVVGAVAGGCAGGDDDAGPATTPPVTPTTTAATTTVPTVPETTSPATEPTAPPSTVPIVTVETTTTTTTLPPTTTTEPLAIQELVLRGDGIGSAVFGAAPEGVIDYVTSILGGNTGDTGWVDPFTFADCSPATVARRVDWGVLSLLFSDLSPYANGRRHLIGFEYGRVGQIGDDPEGLRTPGGVTLGSRVVDLQAEFPEVSVNQGEEDVNIPPNFYVSDVFYGLLTGTAADDVVTVMFGGFGCAE